MEFETPSIPPRFGIYEATDRFRELVERAASGEELVITENGRPLARLIPERIGCFDPSIVDDVFVEIRELSKHFAPDVTAAELSHYIQQGRR